MLNDASHGHLSGELIIQTNQAPYILAATNEMAKEYQVKKISMFKSVNINFYL